MALNIKNAEVERLAAQRIDAALGRFRELFPKAEFERRITKEEEERILGCGPR